jgi:hypothetical protein
MLACSLLVVVHASNVSTKGGRVLCAFEGVGDRGGSCGPPIQLSSLVPDGWPLAALSLRPFYLCMTIETFVKQTGEALVRVGQGHAGAPWAQRLTGPLAPGRCRGVAWVANREATVRD